MHHHRSSLWTAVLLLCFGIALGCATPTTKTTDPTSSETIPTHRKILKNGMTVIIAEDHSSPTFAYHSWFKVGSRDEEPKKTGLAHLFEHMMFKGTTRYPDGQFDRLLEEAGSEGLNAYTTNDVTVYIQELPSKELPLIIELESDRMNNLIVNNQSFKTEVEVVQNERRLRKENNPDGTLFQELFSTAFQKHPYHWPVIGYAEDLAAMSELDAKAFYEKFYRPENAVIVISGSVNPQEALKLIEQKYPQTAPERKIRTYPDEPEQTEARRKRIRLPIQIQKILMGYKTAPFNSNESAAIQVLESVLSDGKSSRLNRALVDSGLATYAGAFQMDNLDAGLFVISAGAQKGKTANHCEKVILKEIEQIIKNGVSEIELTRAKNKILFSFYSSLESNSSRAEFLGKYEVGTGHYKNGYARLKEIESITSENIQAVAKKYLRPEKRTSIIGVPL